MCALRVLIRYVTKLMNNFFQIKLNCCRMSDVDDSLLSQVRHLLWGGGWPVRRRCSVTLARWQNSVNKPASNQLVCNFYGRWPSGIEKTIVWGTRNGWKGGCIFLLLYDTVATWNNWFMAIHNSHTEGDEKKGRKTCIFLNILGSNFMPWSNGGGGGRIWRKCYICTTGFRLLLFPGHKAVQHLFTIRAKRAAPPKGNFLFHFDCRQTYFMTGLWQT